MPNGADQVRREVTSGMLTLALERGTSLGSQSCENASVVMVKELIDTVGIEHASRKRSEQISEHCMS